ncbi:hypothetical protein [Metapseudomonas resinovorans]|uniref:hypothetical protein n=1 Tax=Metapseudomonas resinovorans TaxID=53412 RepID=UPI00230462B4|nr:hypothetical protein [Pseudomonas resinovorans]
MVERDISTLAYRVVAVVAAPPVTVGEVAMVAGTAPVAAAVVEPEQGSRVAAAETALQV